MNKIIIGIIIVVIILGGGIYLMSRQAKDPGENNIAMIRSAYLGTESVVCDFIDPEYEHSTDEAFTLYVKSGKMRISVESADDLSGNIIIKDDYYYFWTEEGGIKMALEKTAEEGFFVPFEVENGKMVIPAQHNLRFSCIGQVIDNSMFEAPADIEFIDMDEISTGLEIFNDDFNRDPEMLEGLEGLEDADIY